MQKSPTASIDETETQEVVTSVYSERFEYKLEIIPPYSIIQCRKATIIERDGVEVGRSYHRHTRSPGEDVSTDCTELKRCAAVLWTPAVVAAYEAIQLQVDVGSNSFVCIISL